MLRKVEIWLAGILLGGIPVITGLLAGWWGSFSFASEPQVKYWAAAGLAAGLLVDLIFLKRLLKKLDSIPAWIGAAVHVFYALGCFGFFMGVPVPITALAFPAGYLVGMRLARSGAPQNRLHTVSRATALFTTVVLAAACCASAVLALSDPYTAANLEGMLRLNFKVTGAMITALILIGGAALLAINGLITR